MGGVQGVTCDDSGTDDLLCMGSAECYVDTPDMIGTLDMDGVIKDASGTLMTTLGTGSTTCNVAQRRH